MKGYELWRITDTMIAPMLDATKTGARKEVKELKRVKIYHWYNPKGYVLKCRHDLCRQKNQQP